MSELPEQIVRALAAANPIGGVRGRDYCTLCSEVGDAPHAPRCPWRLAAEWVAAQDGRDWTDKGADAMVAFGEAFADGVRLEQQRAEGDCTHETRVVREDASAVTCGTCGAALEPTAEDLARLAAAGPPPPHVGYEGGEQ